MFTHEIAATIDDCVLCWLATADEKGIPNVSPKEMFLRHRTDTLLIAHIASPVSVKNIAKNPNVCVSMVDIFRQKGYKFTGTARLIGRHNTEFVPAVHLLTQKFGTKFPIQSVVEVTVRTLQQILAPSYLLFPETTEAGQIASAMDRYGVRPR